MAQESDLSKTADKGKGKAVDDETQKDKAGQPVANGKKDDDKAECLFLLPHGSVCANHDTASEELSEEDQQLKNELDMLVERLTVRNFGAVDRSSRKPC